MDKKIVVLVRAGTPYKTTIAYGRQRARETGAKLLAWLTSGADAPPPEPEPDEGNTQGDPDAITAAQISKIQAVFGTLGITDKEAKRAWVIAALRLEKLDSIKNLKKHEASNLISALEDEESKKKGAAA